MKEQVHSFHTEPISGETSQVPTVFLSYARIDDLQGEVTAFRKSCEAALSQIVGRRCPIYQDIDSIRVGEKWPTSICNAISVTDAFLVVLSPGYLESPNCLSELNLFLEAEEDDNRLGSIVPVHWRTIPLIEERRYNELPDAIARLTLIRGSDMRALVSKNPKLQSYRNVVEETVEAIRRAWTARPVIQATSAPDGNIPLLIAIAGIVETRDSRQSTRVAPRVDLVRRLGKGLGLNGGELSELTMAAILINVGMISVSDAILTKPGKLTNEEYETLKSHVAESAQILRSAGVSRNIVDIVECHHERVDGRGYPRGLSTDQIPLGSRIIAVADAYLVMMASHPYRQGLSQENALRECEAMAGSVLDPAIVDLLVTMVGGKSFRASEDEPEVSPGG